MRKVLVSAAFSSLVMTILAGQPLLAQQGSGSTRTVPPRAAQPKTPEEFYQSFWKYLNRPESPYKTWPGAEDLHKGEGPHGTLIQTHVNKLVVDAPKALPYGAILIADNLADDGKTLQSVSVMFRVKGNDPPHFDWYWLQYQPDGSISRTSAEAGKKAIAGKAASCIECHTKAKGGDYVFSNDEHAPEER